MLQDCGMKTDRIDFISAYCDRWCERCAYTSRCSAFACQAAAAMCGDFEQGLELAVGVPHPVEGEPDRVPTWLEELQSIEMSAQDRAELDRQEAARDARIKAAPLTIMATRHMRLTHQWLRAHRDRVSAAADPIIAEALEIVAYDCFFVGAKLRRALDGRDRSRYGEDPHEDPLQNDWNGSAKVALISLDRSEAAWRVIAQATRDPLANRLIQLVRDLRRAVGEEFPNATSFVRPGFDEPWR
jgi:hypothetical protein